MFKEIKKALPLLLLCAIIMAMCCGCTSSMSYTFNVETGDKVAVKLDTSDGYKLLEDSHFAVEKDDNTILEGAFIMADACDEYEALTRETDTAEILEESSRSDCDYIFSSATHSDGSVEYDYIIRLPGEKTGILIGSMASESEAKAAFERLTFSMK